VGTTFGLHRFTGPLRLRALALAGLLLVVAGCGGGAGASPTASPAGTASASPTAPGAPTPTPGAIGTPVVGPWPTGWDSAFCTMFSEMVVMQELAVDIGRALDEGDRDDALALTLELAASAATVRVGLALLPAWEAAAPLADDLVALLALADEMALRYERYLAQNRRPALGLARAAGAQMNDVVPDLLDRLILLDEAGLACPGFEFNLETPPDQ